MASSTGAPDAPADTTLYTDVMGDLRCAECLPEEAAAWERMPDADAQQLAVLLAAFARDLTCMCGRVIWDARTQTPTSTAGTA